MTSSSLFADLAHLETLDHEGLTKVWRVRIGRKVPSHLPRQLLFRLLPYRLQVQAFGGLDREIARIVDSHLPGTGKPALATKVAGRSQPGSILVREHEGELHRVMVLDRGYAWNGRTFASLSDVAFAITGTKWSGPRFFGLNRRSEGGRADGKSQATANPQRPILGRRTARKAAPGAGVSP